MHRGPRVLSTFLLLAFAGQAQQFRATLGGRVTDPQGAAIPGVAIVVEEVETGAVYRTTSTAEGLFTVPYLLPGDYKLEAAKPGFKKSARQPLHVGTNERVDIDISMEVGQLVETLNVTAEAPLLQTATANSGEVISSRQIADMPMNGRTPLVLAQLAFGVIPSSDPRFNRPFDNSGPSLFSMGGAPAQNNELLLDGAPNGQAQLRVAYNPPVDAVTELKVESFQADAAYGHAGGGTVNVVLKTGTNAPHGSLYEFNQVSALKATPFFTNRAGLQQPVSQFNQWGLTSGGPVYLPGLYDGRNKIFYFFAYEGVEDGQPGPVTSTVPTAVERGGDFSSLLQFGPQYTIYDPATGVKNGSRVQRQAFPGNVIPTNRISPIAANYLQWYPLPNQPGQRDGRDNLLSNSNVTRDAFDNFLGRLDVNVSNRNKLFYDFRYNERLADGSSQINRSVTDVTAGNGLRRTNYGTTLDDVLTISPTMVLDTRLNWTRFTEGSRNFSTGYDITKLGFPATLAANASKAILPALSFTNIAKIGDTGGYQWPQDVFQVFSTASKFSGRHAIKFGADLRLYRQSMHNFGYASGQYTFGNNWTLGPLDNSPASPIGQDLAGFLLGLPTAGTLDLNGAYTEQEGYYALFLQDDIRVRPNLTVNVGLRYEHDLPTTERFDRSTNGFDTTTPSPIAAAAMKAYTANPIPEIPASQFRVVGGLLFANPQNPDLYHTQSNSWSPRFGVAWNPHGGKTVIRGGMGLFFFPLQSTGVNQPGFSQSTSVVPTLDGYLTPAATLTNPFPGGIDQPTGSSQGLATYLGKAVTFYNPAALNSYSVRWNFDLQRQLPGNILAEIGYMGNHAVHLGVDRQLDYIPAAFLSTSPARDQAAIDRLTANVPNPFQNLIPGSSLNGSVVARSQLLYAFPQFSGVTMQQLNNGSAYFEMLEARIEKRYSAGLTLLANYAWSKLIGRLDYLNSSDPVPQKRVSDDDRPQRLVLSGSYELPIGKGKPLAGSAGRWLDRLIGGWVVNAIYTAQPGAPLSWGNVIYLGGALHLNPHGVNGAFDTTRFDTKSADQLGSNLRTFPTAFANLRADGANNIDLSVLKNVRITERFRFQLRGEAFNAFNRPEFNAPVRTPTASNFSQITGQANLPRTLQLGAHLNW
jgi:hypothetical protein